MKKINGIPLYKLCYLNDDVPILSWGTSRPSDERRAVVVTLRYGNVTRKNIDSFIVQLLDFLNEYKSCEFVVNLCCRKDAIEPTREQIENAFKLKHHMTTNFIFYGSCCREDGDDANSTDYNHHVCIYEKGEMYSELSKSYNWTIEQRRKEQQFACSIFFRGCELWKEMDSNLKKIVESFLFFVK